MTHVGVHVYITYIESKTLPAYVHNVVSYFQFTKAMVKDTVKEAVAAVVTGVATTCTVLVWVDMDMEWEEAHMDMEWEADTDME